MIVLVHREGVCMGDDVDTPYARAIHVPDGSTLVEFLKLVHQQEYLPVIDGGRATWVAEGDVPLAVVTQEYREPWPLTNGNQRLPQVAGTLPRPHFFFRYLGQESPEEMYRRLGGDPVHLPKEAWDPSIEINWTTALKQFLTPRRARRR